MAVFATDLADVAVAVDTAEPSVVELDHGWWIGVVLDFLDRAKVLPRLATIGREIGVDRAFEHRLVFVDLAEGQQELLWRQLYGAGHDSPVLVGSRGDPANEVERKAAIFGADAGDSLGIASLDGDEDQAFLLAHHKVVGAGVEDFAL